MGLRVIDNFELAEPKLSVDGKGVIVEFLDADTGERYAMMYEKSIAVAYGEKMVKTGGLHVARGGQRGPQST
jgi:hypothetical protein